MGLWLLQESIRTWESTGDSIDLTSLLRETANVPPFTALVDPDDPVFLPPGDMPSRIVDTCRASGQPTPESPPEVVRCILDSLAVAFRRTIRQAQQLSDHEIDLVHVVGGGARNSLLCQLTADACGLPVLAGPIEAAALGNILVQARSLGAIDGSLDALRALIADTQQISRYEPSGDEDAWEAAETRIYR
jgi:rhamnulokinase